MKMFIKIPVFLCYGFDAGESELAFIHVKKSVPRKSEEQYVNLL